MLSKGTLGLEAGAAERLGLEAEAPRGSKLQQRHDTSVVP